MQRDPVSPLRRWAPTVLAGVLLMGIMLVWSSSTARYAGPDEPAHVLRASSVAAGVLVGDRVPTLDPGYRRVEVAAALTTGDPTCFRHDDDIAATCAVPDPDATGIAAAASSAGTYPPLYYALVGLPVRWFGDPAAVAWYRAVAAGWCALVLAVAAARAVRIGGVLLIGCLTPASWFLFGVVNPNSLEIALAVLAWVGVERLRVAAHVSPAGVAWVSVPAAVAIAIRPVAALAWLSMVGVAVLIDRGLPAAAVVGPRRRIRALFVAPPLFAAATAIVWNVWAAVDISDARTAETVSWWRALRTAADQSTETWREMVGSLGWLEFSAPWVAHVTWWAVIGVSAWEIVRSGDGRAGSILRRAWRWILAVAVAGPIVFEVAFAGRVGFIWQGRYSIASALGLVIVGLSARHDRLSFRTRVAVASAAAVAHVATLWIVLQRYTVGANGSMWFSDARWRPPLSPLSLLALDALLMTGLVVLGAFVDRTAEHRGSGAMWCGDVGGGVSRRRLRPPCAARRSMPSRP